MKKRNWYREQTRLWAQKYEKRKARWIKREEKGLKLYAKEEFLYEQKPR